MVFHFMWKSPFYFVVLNMVVLKDFFAKKRTEVIFILRTINVKND